jgi:hypothetical protein
MQRYVLAIGDTANFERGGSFRLTGRVGNPRRLEDFAELAIGGARSEADHPASAT